MKYQATVYLPEVRINRIEDFLNLENMDDSAIYDFENLPYLFKNFSYLFNNNIKVTFELVQGNHNFYLDVNLVDSKNNKTISISDYVDELLGTYTFEYNEDEYVIEIQKGDEDFAYEIETEKVLRLSQIKSKKCGCCMSEEKDGVECETCPLDSTFSKNHFLTRGYFCRINDFKAGIEQDQEIVLPKGHDAILKFLEIEGESKERKVKRNIDFCDVPF